MINGFYVLVGWGSGNSIFKIIFDSLICELSMTRRLYVAPHIHVLDSLYKDSFPSLKRKSKGLDKQVLNTLDGVFNALKDKPIDIVFPEGLTESCTVDSFNPDKLTPYKLKIYEFAKSKGAVYGKTEDKFTLDFHEILVWIWGFIKPESFLDRSLNKISQILVRRRSYKTGRYVSQQLGENQSGFLLYGCDHYPEVYLDEDIDVVPVTKVVSKNGYDTVYLIKI